LTQESAERTRFFAHPLALIDTDEIGDHARVWAFAYVLKGARIGSDCNIGERTATLRVARHWEIASR
jgi:UDP-3-O-[3-hydroxymyristoyl] glucosamine N-acyltransferase